MCNCYLLKFNWLYRVSARAKNASIAGSCSATPSKLTTKPIKTTIGTSVRSTHVLHFSKPIFLLKLQAYEVCNKLFDRPSSKTKKL